MTSGKRTTSSRSKDNLYRALRGALSGAVIACGLYAVQLTSPKTAAAQATSWETVSSGNGEQAFNVLNNVSCASTTFCVAVGSSTYAPLQQNPIQTPLIETYNGRSWKVTTSPRVPVSPAPGGELDGVSCPSQLFCVAVGYWTPSGNAFYGAPSQALIEIYHGGSWFVDATSDALGPDDGSDQLTGVSCTSAAFCVAVGYHWPGSLTGGNFETLVQSYNGSGWSLMASPQYAGNWQSFLDGVSCSSPSFCTAVGFAYPFAPGTDESSPGSPFTQTLQNENALGIAETFQGVSWEDDPSATAEGYGPLYSVSCTSPDFCAAVGGAADPPPSLAPDVYSTFGGIETYNGSTWSRITAPQLSDNLELGNWLYGVDCTSDTDCVAVGGNSFGKQTNPDGSPYVTQAMVENFNGDSWSPTPEPAEQAQFETLLGVSCASAGCSAVGTSTSTVPQSGETPVPYFSSTLNTVAAATGALQPPPGPDYLVVSLNAIQYPGLGSGSGTVTSSPAGIDCPPTCSAPFKPGTVVTLQLTPAAGSVVDMSYEYLTDGSCTPMERVAGTYVSQVCKMTINGGEYLGSEFDLFRPSLQVLGGQAFQANPGLVSEDLSACASLGATSYHFYVDGSSIGPAGGGCEVAWPLSLGEHVVKVEEADTDGKRKATLSQTFDVVPSANFSWTVDPIPYGSSPTGTPTEVEFNACTSAGALSYKWHFAGSGLPNKSTTSCIYTAELPVGQTFNTTLTITAANESTASVTDAVIVSASYSPPPPHCSLFSLGADACWRIWHQWYVDDLGGGQAPSRPPDYAILGAQVGAVTVGIAVTCDGNVYYGAGFSAGIGVDFAASAVLGYGYVSDVTQGEPTNADIDGFVVGLTASLSVSALGTGIQIVDSGGQFGPVYFAGYTGPSISVGFSDDVGDPGDNPNPTGTCAGGVTSSGTWQTLMNQGVQPSAGYPDFDTSSASSPSTDQGGPVYVAAPAGTFAPGSEVTIAIPSGSTSLTVATVAASETGQLGAKVRLPATIPPGLTHLLLTGVSPSGKSTTIFALALPVTSHLAGRGLWLTNTSGDVEAFGKAPPLGELKVAPKAPVVGMAATPDGRGYWLVSSSGAVSAFGDAKTHKATSSHPVAGDVVGMAATPDGQGYWLVNSSGEIRTFGDAKTYDPTSSTAVSGHIVAMAATPDGQGYWLVNSSGDVWAFGQAVTHALHQGIQPTAHVVAITASPDAQGYWLVTSAGAVSAFGDADAYTAAPGDVVTGTVVGMATTSGAGYWLANSAGDVFSFGNAPVFKASSGSGDTDIHHVVAAVDV
jgi:hypothetical protein